MLIIAWLLLLGRTPSPYLVQRQCNLGVGICTISWRHRIPDIYYCSATSVGPRHGIPMFKQARWLFTSSKVSNARGETGVPTHRSIPYLFLALLHVQMKRVPSSTPPERLRSVRMLPLWPGKKINSDYRAESGTE